jgi:zinc transporter, ZIP family
VLEAAFWGLVTAGSLWVGAALALMRPGTRWVGLAMAFGSGALIAAVAYELVLDAVETSTSLAAMGFAVGALAFYAGSWAIDRRGRHRMGMTGDSSLAGSASAIVLGTVLDGIPESFVLGASILQDGAVPVAVVVGVFAANVPEALSGTVGLLESGWTRARVFAMWSLVVGVSVLAALGGWLLLDVMPSGGGAFAASFAAGALLVMLADTLIPEAFELGGREAGLVTALGFAVGFGLASLRSSGRVRQVGPPSPFFEISSPRYTSTSTPARSMRRRVSGLPSRASARRGARASTFGPCVSSSSSGTSTTAMPRSARSSRSRTGAILG